MATKQDYINNLNKSLHSPQDFLYLFLDQKFLSLIDGNTAQIITQKRANQIKYLHTLIQETGEDATVNFTKYQTKIEQKLWEDFGKSPQKMLECLANGETIAGKNFKEGVYGVGQIYTPNFVTSGYTTNTANGKILYNGAEVQNQTPIYALSNNDVQVFGWSAMGVDGNQYQSYNLGQGYSAYAQSNMNGAITAISASGSGGANTANVWCQILNYLPMILNIISWLMNLSSEKFLNARNTRPSQTEWIDTYDQRGNTMEKLLLLGALGAGVYMISK